MLKPRVLRRCRRIPGFRGCEHAGRMGACPATRCCQPASAPARVRGHTTAVRAASRAGDARVRVILVSDTHLSPAAPEAQANWEAVLRHVAAAVPDVVIHLGDLTLDGARNGDDLHHGRRQLDRLPVAWHAVPGNHDIGDNPWPGAPDRSAADADRRQRWLDIIGADHWSLTTEGWTLLAINAQLLGSGLEAEAAQWSWLEEQVSELSETQQIALVTHKPVTSTDAEMASSPPYRFLPAPGRDRLADLLR